MELTTAHYLQISWREEEEEGAGTIKSQPQKSKTHLNKEVITSLSLNCGRQCFRTSNGKEREVERLMKGNLLGSNS